MLKVISGARFRLRSAVVLGFLMFLNYGLNAISFRMLARGSYLGVASTDALIAWWGFTMVKRIGDAQSTSEKVGYTVGGLSAACWGCG